MPPRDSQQQGSSSRRQRGSQRRRPAALTPGSSLLLSLLLLLLGRATADGPPKQGKPQVWDGGAWHEFDEEIHPDEPRPYVVDFAWVVGWCVCPSLHQSIHPATPNHPSPPSFQKGTPPPRTRGSKTARACTSPSPPSGTTAAPSKRVFLKIARCSTDCGLWWLKKIQQTTQ